MPIERELMSVSPPQTETPACQARLDSSTLETLKKYCPGRSTFVVQL